MPEILDVSAYVVQPDGKHHKEYNLKTDVSEDTRRETKVLRQEGQGHRDT